VICTIAMDVFPFYIERETIESLSVRVSYASSIQSLCSARPPELMLDLHDNAILRDVYSTMPHFMMY
jgi:hypothetical protein